MGHWTVIKTAEKNQDDVFVLRHESGLPPPPLSISIKKITF